MNYKYSEIVEELKRLSPSEFYMKYIVKSYNWYFENHLNEGDSNTIEKIDFFKEIVTKNFGISFHSVQMVGSAKIGFSLAPGKALREFIKDPMDDSNKSSDIDLAIISNSLFEDIWREIRKYKSTYLMKNYKKIASSIFLGYLNDKDFLDLEDFNSPVKRLILETNKELIDELSIMHPISYRIYRSWEDLEDYQLNSITKARSAYSAI